MSDGAGRSDVGQTVLEAEELLCGDPEVLAAIRRAMPAGERDQSDAAKAETIRRAIALAGLIGKTTREAKIADYPGWVRLGAIEAITHWVYGDERRCAHLPTPNQPVPIVAAAWTPGQVCPRCVKLLMFPPGSVKDRTCDGCGHVCACTGGAGGDPIYPAYFTLGLLTYMVGVCTGCMADIPGGPR